MSHSAKLYWEERLKTRLSVAGTGHCGFSKRYNQFMYRRKREVLESVFRRYSIKVQYSDVLDVGSGAGFFVGLYFAKRARSIVGLDIAPVSVRYLREKFPSCSFFELDIGTEPLPTDKQFDIINAFDILYHIVQDDEFKNALKSMGKHMRPGGRMFITDALAPALIKTIHVHYRTAEEYRGLLAQCGIRIVEIVPIFHFLSADVPYCIQTGFIRNIFGTVVDLLAPVWYAADTLYCPIKRSRMNLLICEKK